MTDTSDSSAASRGPDLRERLLRPRMIVSLFGAIAILVFLVTRLDIHPHQVWMYIRGADPVPLSLAVAIYAFTFVLRGIRWRGMLEQAVATEAHPLDLPAYPRMVEVMVLAWFVNSAIPAKLGDAYRCYLMQQDAGVRFSVSLGTIVAERLVDLTVLFVLMSGAGLYAFSGHMPSEVRQTLFIGFVLLVIGLVIVVALAAGHHHLDRVVPGRFRGHFAGFRLAVLTCLRRPWRPLAISVALWGCDGTRLFLVAASLGADLKPSLALFVALMAALLSTLPLTPAGLGVVEAGIVVVLKLVDVNASLAGSIAFVDRLITFWGLLAVGLFLYLRRLRQDVRLTTRAVA